MAGEKITAIHNNCSGKHTFMAAASAQHGDPADYRAIDHPLQRLIFSRVSAWSGVQPALGGDGCGVPTFILPLSAMATAWQVLASEMSSEPRTPLGQIGWAMARFPNLTSGSGRLDLHIVRGAQTPMAVKVGAQGIFCIAVPSLNMGIAVKVHSGVGDALPSAVADTLERNAPGCFRRTEDWPFEVLRNVVGMAVGDFRVEP